MDNYGWDIPSTITSEMNLPPCFWSNRQKETSKSSAQSIVDYGIIRGDVDLTEAFLISSKGLHGVVVKTSEPTKLDGVSEMAGLLLPPSHLESISSSSAAEMSHSQEALWLAAAAELTTSDTATPWRGGLSSLGHLKEHFGLANNECSQVHIDIGDEEDVSAILSNCDNIPNLMSCSGNVSSGESENCSSHRGDKEPHHHCSNVDEVVSQGSPNPDPTGFTPSQSRPNLKRKERGIDDYNAAEGSLYRDVLQSDSCATEGGFRIFFENNQSKWKRPRSDRCQQRASSIDFRMENGYEPDAEAIAQVKEMIYRAAAMRPVSLAAVEALEKPKRKNVKISSDPQTVAARHRRERISERLRVLQRLVPGGSKMDTASMLDEAANYLKFLKSQVSALETLGSEGGIGSMAAASSSPSLPLSSVPFHQSFPMQTLHPQVQTLAQGHPQKGTPAGAPHHLQF